MKTTSHLKSTISPFVSPSPYFVHPHWKGVRQMRKILFAFGITLLGVINATNAACPEGAERPCVIAGKRGHQVCAGQGWSHCVPDEEPPTPSTGKVHPRYYILMVIYAPPGAAALGGASSSVSYGSGSTAGSTVSATSTFKTVKYRTFTNTKGEYRIF